MTRELTATQAPSSFIASLVGNGSVIVIICCILAFAGVMTFGIARKKRLLSYQQNNTKEDRK